MLAALSCVVSRKERPSNLYLGKLKGTVVSVSSRDEFFGEGVFGYEHMLNFLYTVKYVICGYRTVIRNT